MHNALAKTLTPNCVRPAARVPQTSTTMFQPEETAQHLTQVEQPMFCDRQLDAVHCSMVPAMCSCSDLQLQPTAHSNDGRSNVLLAIRTLNMTG
jgi:hypothetical protein